MRIGILTGGGDCPGLNAVIRAVVLTARLSHGDDVVGFLDGWKGALGGAPVRLDVERCREILPIGGTILGTSRTNPFASDGGPERVVANLAEHNGRRVDRHRRRGHAGGGAKARRLWRARRRSPEDDRQRPVGTEVTFGFDTAVQIATDAIDRLRTTAESHHRVIVCEVMGRHAGWIAAHAGIAGGAAEILVPEIPFVARRCLRTARAAARRGQFSSIVVVSEGAVPVRRARDRRRARVSQTGRDHRSVRARPARRDRCVAGRGDRSAYRLRGSDDDTSATCKEGHADGVRSCARDPLRCRGGGGRARRGLRADGRPSRRERSCGFPSVRPSQSRRPSTSTSSWKLLASSPADPAAPADC